MEYKDPAPKEYCLWLRKLVDFGLIDDSDYHRELGKLYGYKKCCIENFVHLRAKNILVGKYMYETYGDDLKETYVRCLNCRPKPFNKLVKRIYLPNIEKYGNNLFSPFIIRRFLQPN